MYWNPNADSITECSLTYPCICSDGSYTQQVADIDYQCSPCTTGKFGTGGYHECKLHFKTCNGDEGRNGADGDCLTEGTTCDIPPNGINSSAVCGALRQCTCYDGVGALGPDCPESGKKCASCAAGKFETADVFGGYGHGCDACDYNYYSDATSPPATECTQCPSGYSNTGIGNTNCNLCSEGYGRDGDECVQCNAADYEFSTGTDASACQDHITCPAGQGSNWNTLNNYYKTRRASECVNCTTGFFSDEDGYGPCTEHTVNCASEYKAVHTVASAFNDEICGGPIQCSCPHGVGTVGSECTGQGVAECVHQSCQTGYHQNSYYNPTACIPHKDCSDEHKNHLADGTWRLDTQCGSLYQCSCTTNGIDVGTGTTGSECTGEGDNICASCSSGYFLTGTTCQPHTDCSAQGKTVKIPGNGTSDVICGDAKQCRCQAWKDWSYEGLGRNQQNNAEATTQNIGTFTYAYLCYERVKDLGLQNPSVYESVREPTRIR